MKIGEWIVLFRLETRVQAKLDGSMRQRLLNELFNKWLQGQMKTRGCLLYTSPSPRDLSTSRMPSSA